MFWIKYYTILLLVTFIEGLIVIPMLLLAPFQLLYMAHSENDLFELKFDRWLFKYIEKLSKFCEPNE